MHRALHRLAFAIVLSSMFHPIGSALAQDAPTFDSATWSEWVLPLGEFRAGEPLSAACRIFVREVGQGEPVVMLHGGWGGEHESLLHDWIPLAAASGRRLVFYDQRGSLRSPCDEPPTVADHVGDLERLREILGAEKIVILGHSMGGWLAQAYAAAHPDRVAGLALIDPTPARSDLPTRSDEVRWERPAVAEELERLGLVLPRLPEDTVQEWSINHRVIFAAVNLHDVTRWREVPVPWFYATVAASSASSSMPDEWDFTADLAALPVPVLVVAGDDDYIPIGSTRAWVSDVPNARLVEVEGAGHLSWIDRPDVVLPAVTRYLSDLDP